MARVVILGAGISGHTAALHLKRRLKREHEVVVVPPNSDWNWIPSNIWVGVGRMTSQRVTSMGAAGIASAGAGMRTGTAAAMTMYPIVPDFGRFPVSGRSLKETSGEIGLGAHWTKLLLHYLFIYKAKARPGWFLIPE